MGLGSAESPVEGRRVRGPKRNITEAEDAEMMKNYMLESIHDRTGDVSERFTNHVVMVYDKFDDLGFITSVIPKSLVS